MQICAGINTRGQVNPNEEERAIRNVLLSLACRSCGCRQTGPYSNSHQADALACRAWERRYTNALMIDRATTTARPQ